MAASPIYKADNKRRPIEPDRARHKESEELVA